MNDLTSLSWPVSRLGEALEALARRNAIVSQQAEPPVPPSSLAQGDEETIGRWIEATAGWLGFEVEPVETSYAEVEQLVRRIGPAILRLPGTGEPRFLAIQSSGRRNVSILSPDLVVHHLKPEVVRAALCHEIEAPLAAEIDHVLAEAGVPSHRRARAQAAILRERLSPRRIGGCWLVRLSPGGSFWSQARQARLPGRFLTFVGAYIVQYFLWLFSWWMIGQAALQGRLDLGLLLAWALLLLTQIPFRLLVTWSEGLLAIGAGGLIKQRLLYGALRLEPDEIRSQGVGQLLGRVIESEAVESLVLSGGFMTIIAVIELVMVTPILAAGAGGGFHVLLLLGWLGVTCFLGWRYFHERSRWTEARLGMTHDLVEQMVGHRTRQVQERREHWHDNEDRALAHYLDVSKAMDYTGALLMALVSRGWLVLGMLGLAPAFVLGHGSPAALAIGLGGVISVYLSLRKLVGGLSNLVGAAIAWRQVAQFFHAAARPEVHGLPAFAFRPNPLTPFPVRERGVT